jgi:hypothetical protein
MEGGGGNTGEIRWEVWASRYKVALTSLWNRSSKAEIAYAWMFAPVPHETATKAETTGTTRYHGK